MERLSIALRTRQRAQGLVEYTLGIIAVIVAGLIATTAYGTSLQQLFQRLVGHVNGIQ